MERKLPAVNPKTLIVLPGPYFTKRGWPRFQLTMSFGLHLVCRHSASVWNGDAADWPLGPISVTSMSLALLAHKEWSTGFLGSLRPFLEYIYKTKIWQTLYDLPHFIQNLKPPIPHIQTWYCSTPDHKGTKRGGEEQQRWYQKSPLMYPNTINLQLNADIFQVRLWKCLFQVSYPKTPKNIF